jgi:hypothetical protein
MDIYLLFNLSIDGYYCYTEYVLKAMLWNVVKC